MSKIAKEKAHAKIFSASNSSKWLNCPGSIEAENQFPEENKENTAAEEGTLAHELADMCLKLNMNAEEFIDRTISCEYDGKVISKIIDWEMANFVQEYLDYVRSFETNKTQLFTEDRVSFENIIPKKFRNGDDGFGTLDAAILDYDEKTLHIFDFKYGIGVKVEVEENTQGQLYALGLYNELKFLGDIEKFIIHIVQPRKYYIGSWEISLKKLLEFGEFAKERAKMVVEKNPVRIPGEKQCQWCKAKNNCKALEKFTEETIAMEFDDLDEKKEIDSNIISSERLKLILDNKDLVIKFLNSIEERAFEEIKNGNKIPGYKIVAGRSNRKWIEEAEEILKEKLKEKAYKEPALITITEAEKLMNKKEVNELTYKPEGNPKLVKESEKGEPISFVKVEDFEIIKDKS